MISKPNLLCFDLTKLDHVSKHKMTSKIQNGCLSKSGGKFHYFSFVMLVGWSTHDDGGMIQVCQTSTVHLKKNIYNTINMFNIFPGLWHPEPIIGRALSSKFRCSHHSRTRPLLFCLRLHPCCKCSCPPHCERESV